MHKKRIPERGTRPSVGTREDEGWGGDPCGRPRPRSHISLFPYDEWRRDLQVSGGTPTRVPAPPLILPRPYEARRHLLQRHWFSLRRLAA